MQHETRPSGITSHAVGRSAATLGYDVAGGRTFRPRTGHHTQHAGKGTSAVAGRARCRVSVSRVLFSRLPSRLTCMMNGNSFHLGDYQCQGYVCWRAAGCVRLIPLWYRLCTVAIMNDFSFFFFLAVSRQQYRSEFVHK